MISLILLLFACILCVIILRNMFNPNKKIVKYVLIAASILSVLLILNSSFIAGTIWMITAYLQYLLFKIL